MIRGSLCVVAWLALAGLASAETVRIEATGQADASRDNARQRAIDKAFARAIDQAVSSLATADARRPFRREIRAQVTRRARRYVASFKVTDQEQTDDTLRVVVDVKVEIGAIRDKLVDIGVELIATEDFPDNGDGDAPDSGDDTARERPKVVLLVHATVGDEVFATFGQKAGDGGVAGRELARHLREQGFELASAGEAAVPVSPESPDGVPLTDQAAVAIARESGAGGAFVIGIELREGGRIRGTALVGASARATIRVLEVSETSDGDEAPTVVASARRKAGGFGDTDAAATTAAATAGAERLVLSIARNVTEYWPPEAAEDDGAFAIEVTGYRAWPSVAALLRHLRNTRGIERVWPRRLGKTGLSLAVVTELNQRRLASAIRKAELPEPARASVRKRGERSLKVKIRGDRGTSER